MAGVLPADSLQTGTYEGALYNNQQLEDGTGEDGTGGGGRWYYSRKEIEENSASRKDGIDLKKETYLRKSYCTFLQDLGMRLKVYVLCIKYLFCFFIPFKFFFSALQILIYMLFVVNCGIAFSSDFLFVLLNLWSSLDPWWSNK